VVFDLASVYSTATNYVPRWWWQGENTLPQSWTDGSTEKRGTTVKEWKWEKGRRRYLWIRMWLALHLYGNTNPFYTRNYLLGSTSSSFTSVDSHACMNHWNEGGRPHRFKLFNCLWVQATVTVNELTSVKYWKASSSFRTKGDGLVNTQIEYNLQ